MKRQFWLYTFLGVFAWVAVGLAAAPKVVTFTTKKGTVTFKHTEHQARADKCSKCHHTAKDDGSDAKKCSTCHQEKESEKDGKKVPAIKKAAHKRCKDCHKEKGKGPSKCKECHVK